MTPINPEITSPTIDEYRNALESLINVINVDSDGDMFICKESEGEVEYANELLLRYYQTAE